MKTPLHFQLDWGLHTFFLFCGFFFFFILLTYFFLRGWSSDGEVEPPAAPALQRLTAHGCAAQGGAGACLVSMVQMGELRPGELVPGHGAGWCLNWVGSQLSPLSPARPAASAWEASLLRKLRPSLQRQDLRPQKNEGPGRAERRGRQWAGYRAPPRVGLRCDLRALPRATGVLGHLSPRGLQGETCSLCS